MKTGSYVDRMHKTRLLSTKTTIFVDTNDKLMPLSIKRDCYVDRIGNHR